MRTQIWSCHKKVKGNPTIIIWTDLVDLESSMLYTKIQVLKLSWFWRRRFLSACYIWAWRPSCSMSRNYLSEQVCNTLSTEGPMWNLVKSAQAVLEKKIKDCTILYIHIALGQEHNNHPPPHFDSHARGKMLIITKMSYYFNNKL